MAIGLSILEQEDALKGLPTQALQQMMRQPSPDAPPFLVAAELKRREQMKKEFVGKQAEAQTAQQAPTVAHRLAGQQQPMPMSQAGAMAAPPQQPPMPKEAQLAMALSGATGQPPPQLPTVNMQGGTSGAAMREMAKALRGEGTRSYAQRRGHQPFSSRERPPPVTPAGLALLLAAIQQKQSEPERAYGGFDISEDIRLPRGRSGARAAARPVTAANGTQGRTVYAADGWPPPPPAPRLPKATPVALSYFERLVAAKGRGPEAYNKEQDAVLKAFGGARNWFNALGVGTGEVPAAPSVETPKWKLEDADKEYGEGRLAAPETASDAAPVPQEFQGAPGPQVDADVMDFEFGGGEFRPAEEAVPEIVARRTSPPRRGNIPNPRFTEAVGEQYRQYGEEMARRGPPPSSVGVPRFTEAELFPASDPVEQDGQSGTGAEVLSDLLIPADFAGSEAIPDEVYGAGLGVLSGPPPPAAVADQWPLEPALAAAGMPRIYRSEPVAPPVPQEFQSDLSQGAFVPRTDAPTQRKFRVGPQTEMLIGSLRLNERAERMPADQLLSEIEQSGRLPEGFDGKGIDPQILRRANLQALLAVQEARAPGLEIDVAQREAALSRELVEPGTLRPEERVRLAEKKRLPRLSPRQVGELKRTWGSKGIAANNIGSRLEQKLSTFLSGADKDRVKIDDAETAKRIKAIGDSVRESAGEERRILIDQQNDAIEKIATADKASLEKISDGMAALKDFQETGRLPKKHRDALINAGLMEFGAALLDPNNPTLYGAFSAGLRGFQKIEKGKRKEYLDGLKYALTAETAQQTLAMKVRNSEAAARRQLAQFQVATQKGDEAAAVAAETRASNEINNARRYALQLQTAEIAQITAFASILNATKPGVRIQEFNMLMDKTLEEAQALAKEGDFSLMDKAFVTSGGKVTPKTEYFVDLFTSMSGSAFRDYIAIETFKRGERSEAARTRSSAAAAADRLIADFKHPLWKTILGREPTPDEWKLNKNDYYNKAVRHFLGGGSSDVEDPLKLKK